MVNSRSPYCGKVGRACQWKDIISSDPVESELFSGIDPWRDQQIALPQAKTGRLLVLPLLPEVADALIAYLRHGRPQAECRNVFVRHLAPYEPFVPDNNLATIVQEALRRAGLESRHGRKGLYLF